MNIKIDFKKSRKAIYNPQKSEFHLVDVPQMNFLMINGQGDPNTALEYKQALEILYALSYGIKFVFKPLGYDHVVPPLEGLWWTENMDEFSKVTKDQWKWTMMIMQPEWVTLEVVDKVRHDIGKKKGEVAVSKARFELFSEGLSVQILYTGAYQNEAPTIASMHQYISANGFVTNGKHHEIYLSDPRKTSPEKLKTIIRQPIRKK